ncbi:unnamed protein product [Rotaria sp. Silwood1]|nr:unnamed protein product [Rotaria sp. Silwood1]CAF4884536.1 unnamed protein product [Rotaria sp. Silwood1]
MKRSFNLTKQEYKSSSLISLDGYVVNVGAITKNNNNENHHYSFLFSLMDQSTVRITKFLSKVPSCTFYKRLQESMFSGNGTCISGLCTIEVKICEIGADIACIFKESDFKNVQKLKKVAVVDDATGALELTLWESHFGKVELGSCYQIKLVKSRLINCKILLSANVDTSFMKIEDLEIVQTHVECSIMNSRICKGRIIHISKHQVEYACQAYGNHDVTQQTYCIVCNICQSRTPKYDTGKDELLKFMITTDNREEYNLSVSEIISIPMLTCINESYTNIAEFVNEEYCTDALTDVMIEFKFDQNTGIISELTFLKKNDLRSEDINKFNYIKNFNTSCIFRKWS